MKLKNYAQIGNGISKIKIYFLFVHFTVLNSFDRLFGNWAASFFYQKVLTI